MIFIFSGQAVAQSDEENTSCIGRRDLLQMVHAPVSDPNSTTLMDLMDSKGYQLGSDTVFLHDTINGIILNYRCQIYYSYADGEPRKAVYICESEEGLSNVIIYFTNLNKMCGAALTNEFYESGYMYDGRRNVYTGRDAFENHSGIYEAEYRKTGGQASLVMRYQDEIDDYVSREADLRRSHVYALIQIADSLAQKNLYSRAFFSIDTLIGYYRPMDGELGKKRTELENRQREYFYMHVVESVNTNRDFPAAVSWCDSLLGVDSENDSIKSIRQVLVDQTMDNYQRYSKLMPDVYDTVVSHLEELLNNEIEKNRTSRMQSLTYEFVFNTTQENLSHGNVTLDVERKFLQSRLRSFERASELQIQIDSLARWSIIKPIYRYGININTKERLAGQIEWQFGEVEVGGYLENENRGMKKYTDSIDWLYFRNADPSSGGKTRMKLPYSRDYTFGITRKHYKDSVYIDVSLMDFKTSTPLSWMPSLLIPGLGTEMQGYTSSVSARSIPFFLFGGLSVVGFVLKSQDYIRTDWSESGGEFWHYKNFDNILAYGGGIIAGSIYITDLVQSIKATVVNMSRSKKLREDLRKREISVRKDRILIH